MGSKYTVLAWGKHFEDHYSDLCVHSGPKFWPAVWAVFKARRAGYGCVTLGIRA